MRVSIVIPLYNKERWIRRALDSIAGQTFTDFELLVVNDGSSDGGAQIVTNYGDRRFRLITQRNAGPGAARNRGIGEAKGELLAFLDADDEWLPNYLEDSIRLLDNLGEDVASVSSGYLEHPSAISRESMWRARGITEGPFRLCPNTPPLAAVYRLVYMSPCSTVVRADILRKWGGFYGSNRCLYGEDSYIWLKIILNETVAFHLDPIVCFHVEASELSKNLKGPRPLEPFLLAPSEIETVCPPDLRDLLSKVLAIRAFKTACMLGYWGQWREARSIRKRFSVPGDWKLSYYLPGMICSTPVGASLGQLRRALKRIGTAA
jgi:glycosyltransferase involved in cell wall biosynthesis